MRSKSTLRALLAGAVGVVALLAFAPAVSAQYGPPASITLASPTVTPGGSDAITMSGCAPGATADFMLADGTSIGSGEANEEGIAVVDFTVPSGTAPGTYEITGTCEAPDGSTLTLTTELEVVAGGDGTTTTTTKKSGTGTLPVTGSDNSALVRGGIALVAAGGIAALIARKRSQAAA